MPRDLANPARPFTVAGTPSSNEVDSRRRLADLYAECPIPESERLSNLGLYLTRQNLTRMMFMTDLYRRILDVNGVIMEFGVRWGQNMALFTSLRGALEPYNYTRRIIGFDTFSGFPSVDAKDGESNVTQVGAYGVTEDYDRYLSELLDLQEQESPISHIRKHELVKGDAVQTVRTYLDEHPETIIALAYFDLDIYEPTRACLEAVRPHLTRGSVLGFDELNCPEFPGETTALKEVFGLDQVRLQRTPLASYPSFAVIE